MEIPKQLKDEIWNYCRLNDITNIDDFTLKLLKQGFTYEKYGSPIITNVVNKVDDDTTDLSEVNEIKEALEKSKSEITSLSETNKLLKEQLEKEKNKRDLYGEK